MPNSNKPKLPQLTTPVSGTFPSEAVCSATTPLSARPAFARPASATYAELAAKTPISPPPAYMDFLKTMSLNSPVTSRRSEASSGETTPESVPSTASSEQTSCSCKCQQRHKATTVTAMSAPPVPPSPFSQLPMSAPPSSAESFPSLKIPPSPAFSAHVDSPLSATPARSPFSARSIRSAFDWDAALKARCTVEEKEIDKKKKKTKSSRTSVRHIREVVTRTVTYNHTPPRMNPAPKGKRRKVEHAQS